MRHYQIDILAYYFRYSIINYLAVNNMPIKLLALSMMEDIKAIFFRIAANFLETLNLNLLTTLNTNFNVNDFF